MKKSALFFVIFFVGFFGAFSQVRVEYNETRKLLTEEGVFPSKTDYPDIRLPKFDFTTLREKSVKLDPNIPFQFGKAFDMDLSLDDGKWYESPGGKVWKLRITSDNSYSLNLVFSKLNLGEGARMYIYNDQRNMLVGPFDNNNTKINEVLITDLIKGSSITVELYEPEMSSNSELVISKVIHGFIDTFSVGFGQSANCNIDVDCPVGQPFGLESNSVSRILINNGQSFCSGALINNTCNDFTPFLLTANHCLVGNPGDFVFRFQYRSPSPQCDGQGGGGDSQVNIFYNGSQLAANNADTDFGLLLMNNRPDHANVSFLGGQETQWVSQILRAYIIPEGI